MSRVSAALEALRDAIHRHPWWTDSLLALFLTFISIGSVIFGDNRHQAHAIAVLDAVLVSVTTVPIALRRYRPLAVLAITVSAETALLLFSTQTQVPFGVIVALYTCQEGLSWRWRSRTREQPGCNTSVSSECFRRALARAVGYARALAGWRSFSCGWLLVTPCGSRALEGLVRWFEWKVSERLYADFGSWR